MNNTPLKNCIKCNTPKLIDEYYKHTGRNTHSNVCKTCYNEQTITRRTNKYIEDGHPRIRQHPNIYNDEFEKEQTFELMERMGWIFNQVNNKWFKIPLKDSNGNWFFQ